MEELAAVFKALSDPTRLRIFDILRRQCWEMDQAGDEGAAIGPNVGAIHREVDISGATLSHHLKELRQAGLIRTERCGRKIMCCVNADAVMGAAVYLGSADAASCDDCC